MKSKQQQTQVTVSEFVREVDAAYDAQIAERVRVALRLLRIVTEYVSTCNPTDDICHLLEGARRKTL